MLGFSPRDIEVAWEWGGQVAQGEQLTRGIRPNGDPTFQIQESTELGQEGLGPTEHVCVVRHISLGGAPLRVTWDSQPTSRPGVLVIVPVCILAALGIGTLGWYLRRRQGACKGPYRLAQTQPWTIDSAPATARTAGGASSTALSLPDATE
ncbi:unnamed protein product [Caretta caretta]